MPVVRGMWVRRTSVCLLSVFLLLSSLLLLAVSVEVGKAVTSRSNSEFIVRYCTHVRDLTDTTYADDNYLFVYSNGTVTYRSYLNSTYGNHTGNWTYQLSDALVASVYNTLIGGGFLSLKDSYGDPGWYSAWSTHTERVCFEQLGELKTVTFGGRNIMGVIPAAYALLNNIEQMYHNGMTDVSEGTLDIRVIEPSDRGPVASISANFTNNGEMTLSDAGLCNRSWPTYIVSREGRTVGNLQNWTIPECFMTFEPQTTREFGPWMWNRTGLLPGDYVIMSKVVIWDYVVGKIDSNMTWTSSDDNTEPAINPDDNGALYLALGASLATGAVIVTAFYLVRARGKNS